MITKYFLTIIIVVLLYIPIAQAGIIINEDIKMAAGKDSPRFVTEEELKKNLKEFKKDTKKRGGKLITKEYLQELKDKEIEEVRKTGKLPKRVNVTDLDKYWAMQDARKLDSAKGSLVKKQKNKKFGHTDYRKGGLFK